VINYVDIIKSPDEAHIESISECPNGNSNVYGFDSRNKIMKYFPENLNVFYPNLKQIAIYNAKMKEISQKHLKFHVNLVNFYLDNNDITTLENGLFDYNPDLQGVSFTKNKLKVIGNKVFSTIPLLTNLWLDENFCISDVVKDNYRALKNLLNQINEECQYIIYQDDLTRRIELIVEQKLASLECCKKLGFAKYAHVHACVLRTGSSEIH
jgi:hypothetical protein